MITEKWPVLGWRKRAAEWLQIWTNPGRAPRMIDAYARGLGEYWRRTGLVSFVVVFARGLRWPRAGELPTPTQWSTFTAAIRTGEFD